jgi:hypothetical protein
MADSFFDTEVARRPAMAVRYEEAAAREREDLTLQRGQNSLTINAWKLSGGFPPTMLRCMNEGSGGGAWGGPDVDFRYPPRPTIQRTPTLPPAPADDPAVEARRAVERVLRPAIERVLTDASDRRDLDFSAALAAAVATALASDEPGARNRAEETARQIAAIKEPVALPDGSGGTYDIPLLLLALDGLHRDATAVKGVTVSAGLRQVIRSLGEHATSAIIEVLPGTASFSWMYLSALRADIAYAASAVGDATALLRLELEGTITELISLRAEFAGAIDQDERARIGATLGETARQALLLDHALQRATTAPGRGPTPLDTAVEQRAADIAQLRRTAATEHATRSALGDDLALLAERPVTIAHGPTDTAPVSPLGEYADAIVQPEEALPETTDAAERTMAGELGARIAAQRAELKQLRGRVVPEQPSYTLPEFIDVHRRWYSLHSVAQEKQEPMVQMVLALMGEPYQLAGTDLGDTAVAVEGGVVRSFLMAFGVDILSQWLRGDTDQFGAQVDAPGPARSATTTGTAKAPEYRSGELYPGTAPGTPSRSGEVDSRTAYQARRQQETATATTAVAALPEALQPGTAARLGLASGPDVPIVGLHATTAQQGWSYLTDVRDGVRGDVIVAREHKVVPPEVAAYLLARRQQTATLARPHRPAAGGRPLGSAPMRSAGVERATATSAARYVEGQSTPQEPPEVANLQTQLGAASRESGVRPGRPPPDTADLVGQLRGDLLAYLEAYFTERQSMEYRLAAIFAIGDAEHGVGAQLMSLLDPKNLAMMVGEAVKIAAIMAVLEMLGPLGAIVAQAYGAYLRSQGISNVAALISIAAFCRNAADADTFAKARAWGYMTVHVADDAGQLFNTLVTTPVTVGLHALTTAKPSSPRDLADAVRPLMNDPVIREGLLRDVEAHIAELEAKRNAGAELDSLRGFHDALLQRSTRQTAEAAEAPLPGVKDEPGSGALFTRPHERSAKDKEALQNALGRDIPLVESTALEGTAVHVRYGDDGKVRVEIGPAVEPTQIRQHLATVHELRRYEGVFGRIRQLLGKLKQLITGHPAYGTEGFEARLEVQKLRAIEVDLMAQLRAVEARADRLTGEHAPDAATAAAAIRGQIEAIQHQVATHEVNVDSYKPGRGFVAAEDTSSARVGARERAKKLIERATAAAPGVRATLIQATQAHGAELARLGTEVKTEESLTRKIYDRAAEKVRGGDPDPKVLDSSAGKINDALRYTVVADPARYMETHQHIRTALETAGYRFVKEGDAWAEPERFGGGYRGINMTFRTAEGLEFEVQVHTAESLAMVEETHPLLEEHRAAGTSRERREELNQEMRRLASKVATPPGAGAPRKESK